MNLKSLETPPANGRPLWQWIAHSVLEDALLSETKNRGWAMIPISSSYGPSGGLDWVASWSINFPKGKKEPQTTGAKWLLGIQNYHSRKNSTAVRLLGGLFFPKKEVAISMSSILVCKHVRGVNLSEKIQIALEKFEEELPKYDALVKYLTAKKIQKGKLPGLLILAAQSKNMPWSRIAEIQEAEPENLWELLFAFAAVAKRNPPLKQAKQIFNYLALIQGDRK